MMDDGQIVSNCIHLYVCMRQLKAHWMDWHKMAELCQFSCRFESFNNRFTRKPICFSVHILSEAHKIFIEIKHV
jgi:hypothetical protein